MRLAMLLQHDPVAVALPLNIVRVLLVHAQGTPPMGGSTNVQNGKNVGVTRYRFLSNYTSIAARSAATKLAHFLHIRITIKRNKTIRGLTLLRREMRRRRRQYDGCLCLS